MRTALIPWVIALVALFGLNAIAPNHSLTKKSDSLRGIGLSQQSADIQTPGRFSNSLAYVAPTPCDWAMAPGSSLLLCIETRMDHTVVQSLRGAVRGRAPPWKALA